MADDAQKTEDNTIQNDKETSFFIYVEHYATKVESNIDSNMFF